ncbi:MAG: hypothetical protein AAGI71_03975 [Bacteroidota bacterium]
MEPFSDQEVGATTQPCPFESPPEEPPAHWVEIVLVGEDDSPVDAEPYEVTLPDGTVVHGALDANGRARIPSATPGTCQVSFPHLDEAGWALVS